MALTNNKKDVIERFLKRYNEYYSSSFCVTTWPDEFDRTGKSIDAIAEDGPTLGIEHTLLQPFSGEKQDSDAFTKTIGQLDKKPSLVVPDLDVDVTVTVGAIQIGFDWSFVAPAVEGWYLTAANSIPVGESVHQVPNLPISLTIAVNKV